MPNLISGVRLDPLQHHSSFLNTSHHEMGPSPQDHLLIPEIFFWGKKYTISTFLKICSGGKLQRLSPYSVPGSTTPKFLALMPFIHGSWFNETLVRGLTAPRSLVWIPHCPWPNYPSVAGPTPPWSLVSQPLHSWSNCPSVPVFLKPDRAEAAATRARRHARRESRAKIDVCGLRCKAEVPPVSSW